MTSVLSLANSPTANVPSPKVISKQDNNLYSVNFRADDKDQFVRQGKPKGPVYTQPPMLSPNSQLKRLEDAQKKEKRKQNLSWGLGIAASLAIVLMAISALRGGKGSAASELKELTDVPLKWTIFGKDNKVASLDSKTTAPKLRKELGDLIDISKMSDKAKEWAGIKDRAKLYFMYGESGVGKTYAAKQYAQELGAQYTCIKYGDLGSPFKDAGSMKILNMFKNVADEATKNPDKKFVVCVDEIDALLRKVTEQGGKEASNARSSVLTGIDDLVSRCKNVTVIATSNYHPQSKLIDGASMRRFHAKIEVPLPNKEQTEELLKMYLKGPKGLKDEFFATSEFKAFVDELVKGKYANGEIETIAKAAKDKFGVSVKNIPDGELEKHLFNINFLKDSKSLYGNAAAIANDTMRV